jgi:hypothetical protein
MKSLTSHLGAFLAFQNNSEQVKVDTIIQGEVSIGSFSNNSFVLHNHHYQKYLLYSKFKSCSIVSHKLIFTLTLNFHSNMIEPISGYICKTVYGTFVGTMFHFG